MRPAYRPQQPKVVAIQDRRLVDDKRRQLVPHGPVGLELLLHRGLCENGVAGELADPTGTVPDGAQLHGRDAAAVAADRARLAAIVRGVGKLARRREVEAGEGAGCDQGVAGVLVSMDFFSNM